MPISADPPVERGLDPRAHDSRALDSRALGRPAGDEENQREPLTLARFEIVRQIAVGPDGVHYRALDKQDGARVDLLHLPGIVGDRGRKQDWTARLRKALVARDTSFLRVQAFDLDGSAPIAILESPPTATLSERLIDASPEARLDWAAQLVSGIASGHRVGLYHGAIRADSIAVDGENRLRFDFVAASAFGEAAIARSSDPSRWPVDDAEEIPALGALLRELLDPDTLHLLSACRTPRQAAQVRILTARCGAAEVGERPGVGDLEAAFEGLRTTPPLRAPSPCVSDETTNEWIPDAPVARTPESDVAFDPDATSVTGGAGGPVAATISAPATLSEDRLVPGSTLGRFRIVRKIAQGGMGAVFEAVDPADDGRVAIKTLRGSAAAMKQAMQRFKKEARLLASVRNAHVANLIEVNEEQGLQYLVLEYVEGPTLKTMIERHGALDEPSALRIACDVARGLLDAHRQGIVHRDVKPENVLLRRLAPDEPRDGAIVLPDGLAYQVKLSDFGIARQIDQSESLALTQAGAILGTPRYMSPEQCKGAGSVTPQTDIYSLGVTLFELMAGRTPFDASDAMRLAAQHCFEAAPPLSRFARLASPASAALVAKALSKAPADRFADASHFLRDALRAATGEETVSADRMALPDADPARLFQVDFVWDLAATPAELWPYVSDTDRFNRASGLPLPTYRTFHDESGMRRIGSMRLAGIPIEWEERPFEWIEGRRMGVLREFARGPFAWFANVVELESLPSGGTRLTHRVRILPRGPLGRLVANVEVDWKARRKLEQVYQRIDRTLLARRGAPSTGDPYEEPARLASSRRDRLNDRLARALGKGAQPDVLGKLAGELEQAPDPAVSKIRPLEFARRFRFDENVALEGFLYAASEGLLSLRWEVLCPTCRVASETVDSLREVREHAYCEACDLEYASDAADALELVFQVHPEIRKVSTAKYCVGGPYHAPHVVAQLRLAGGERIELETSLSDGRYVLRGPELSQSISVIVRPTGATYLGDVTLEPGRRPDQELALRSGRQVFALRNAWERSQVVRLERTAGRQDALTATRASSVALFRELFPGETLSSGLLVTARRAAFLATTVVDVDDFYRRVGDGKAFAVVNRHAEIVAAEVADRRGTCTRSAGDGIFAIFDDAVDATRCALALHERLSRDEATSALRVSVGVHAGSAVVTTSNGRLDYFGYASRVAARLAEAGEGDVLISDAVFADPAVETFLRSSARPSAIAKLELPGAETLIARRYAWSPSVSDELRAT